MSNQHYVLVDGDSIGEKIDALILRGELAELETFTHGIDQAVARIAFIARGAGAAIHMAGGDNLLLAVADVDRFIDVLEAERPGFCASFSVGIGDDAKEALAALQAAKGVGPGTIVRTQKTGGAITFSKRGSGRTWVAL